MGLSAFDQIRERESRTKKMAVPRHHMAKGKQLRRRSHFALKAATLTVCSHCKRKITPHAVCRFCGFYKGREVINVLARELKKKEKARQRAQT